MTLVAFFASRCATAANALLAWAIYLLLAPSEAWDLTAIETTQRQQSLRDFSPPPLTPDSTCEEMLQWTPPRAQSEFPLLVQVVNEAYLRIQQNFILLMKQNSAMPLSNLYLLCIGENTVRTLNGMEGVRCVEVDGMESTDDMHVKKYHLFEYRTKVLRCLVVEKGRDVLMSDNDALWVKDPLPDLLATEGDLLAQRAHWPHYLVEPVYGVTICAGFVFYRAGSEGMPTFLNAMLSETVSRRDDRKGLIEATRSLHLKWDYDLNRSDMRQAESTNPGYGLVPDLPGNFTVVLLPQSTYTRNNRLGLTKDTIVAHIFDVPQREEKMKLLNLWLVD